MTVSSSLVITNLYRLFVSSWFSFGWSYVLTLFFKENLFVLTGSQFFAHSENSLEITWVQKMYFFLSYKKHLSFMNTHIVILVNSNCSSSLVDFVLQLPSGSLLHCLHLSWLILRKRKRRKGNENKGKEKRRKKLIRLNKYFLVHIHYKNHKEPGAGGSGGRDQEDGSSKLVWANSSQDPISKNQSQKNVWWSGSRCRLWVQTPVLQKKQKEITEARSSLEISVVLLHSWGRNRIIKDLL
jgi:hypothetical protein